MIDRNSRDLSPDVGTDSAPRSHARARQMLLMALVLATACMLSGCASVDGADAPAPQTNVGRQVMDLVQDATAVLSGVENLPSAREAAPRLERIDASLTEALKKADRLPRPAQQRLGEAIDGVLPDLLGQINRVQEIAGVPGTLRPVLDGMRDRLQAARLQESEIPDTPYTTPQ